MDATKSIVFAATVLPLVCTPGPDLIYVAAQALAGGRKAALRANAGVILGYVAHAYWPPWASPRWSPPHRSCSRRCAGAASPTSPISRSG